MIPTKKYVTSICASSRSNVNLTYKAKIFRFLSMVFIYLHINVYVFINILKTLFLYFLDGYKQAKH